MRSYDRHPESRRRRRRLRTTRMVRVLPSMFTLGNLLCGFAAIFFASRPIGTEVLLGRNPVPVLVIAAAFVFIGMVLDALDGRIARLTRGASELGEQLDSMADMVTFGVAPAFLVIQLVDISTPFFGETHPKWNVYFERAVFVVAGVYAACTALRLARFNIELEQPGESDHLTFKGLPSPAAAGTVCSLVLLHQWLVVRQPAGVEIGFLTDWPKQTAAGMVAVTLLAAIAMVSTIRYVHFANRFLRDRAPIHYIGYATFVLIPLLIWPQVTLAIAFVGYALSAPAMLLARQAMRKPHSHRLPTGAEQGEGLR